MKKVILSNEQSAEQPAPVNYPLVSVVIPLYNHERYIADAIQSAIDQDYPNIEIIVVDDGSIDASLAELVRQAGDYPHLKIIQQENAGSHAAINRGLQSAVGDWFAILNSDDVWPANRISRLIAHAQEPNSDFLFSDVQLIDENGSLVADHDHWWNVTVSKFREHLLSNGVRRGLLYGNMTVSTSNFFLSKAALSLLGEFRPLKYNLDWEYALRATHAKGLKVDFVQEKLLEYRLHGENTILSGMPIAALEALRISWEYQRRDSGRSNSLILHQRRLVRQLRRFFQSQQKIALADTAAITVDRDRIVGILEQRQEIIEKERQFVEQRTSELESQINALETARESLLGVLIEFRNKEIENRFVPIDERHPELLLDLIEKTKAIDPRLSGILDEQKTITELVSSTSEMVESYVRQSSSTDAQIQEAIQKTNADITDLRSNLSTGLAGVLSDIGIFRDDNTTQFNEIEELNTQLHQKIAAISELSEDISSRLSKSESQIKDAAASVISSLAEISLSSSASEARANELRRTLTLERLANRRREREYRREADGTRRRILESIIQSIQASLDEDLLVGWSENSGTSWIHNVSARELEELFAESPSEYARQLANTTADVWMIPSAPEVFTQQDSVNDREDDNISQATENLFRQIKARSVYRKFWYQELTERFQALLNITAASADQIQVQLANGLQLRNDIEESEASNQQLALQNSNSETQIRRLTEDLEQTSRDLESARSRNSLSEAKIEELNQYLVERTSTLDKFKQDLESARSRNLLAESRIEELDRSLAERDTELERVELLRANAESLVRSTEEALATTRAALSTVDLALADEVAARRNAARSLNFANSEIISNYYSNKKNMRNFFNRITGRNQKSQPLAVVDATPAVNVHIHMYYKDLAEEFKSYLEAIGRINHLVITGPWNERELESLVSFATPFTRRVSVAKLENRGKDVGGFLHAVRELGLLECDYVLKIHSKKSNNAPTYFEAISYVFGTQITNGDDWRRQIIQPMAGSSQTVENVISTFESDPTIGLAGPANFITAVPDINKDLYSSICNRYGVVEGQPFFAGTMFWARAAALAPLLTLGHDLSDFTLDSREVEGGLEHIYERMFGPIVLSQGYQLFPLQ